MIATGGTSNIGHDRHLQGSPMNSNQQMLIEKFASAKVSERSNETLRKSPLKTITRNDESIQNTTS